MIKFFKYLVPLLGTIGLGYLASDGSLGANVETAAVAIAASVSPLLAMAVDILKNGMPGMVVAKVLNNAKEGMNDGDYELVIGLFKKYGVQGIADVIGDGLDKLQNISNAVPLIVAIGTAMNKNGAFDEDPILKEIVEKSLTNVNSE